MKTQIKSTDFLARAQSWLDWVRSYTERQDKMIEIAASKPVGYDHDPNLVLDSEGEVWEPVFRDRMGTGFVRLTRGSVHETYQRTSDFIPHDGRAYNGGHTPFEIGGRVFVAKGWDRPDGDWAWRPPRAGSRGTRSYYEESLRSTLRGERLGVALMALSPEAIDQWATEWAEVASHDGQRRSSDHVGYDWERFSAHFNLPPKSDVPDFGGVLCALHLLVDRAAGFTRTAYSY